MILTPDFAHHGWRPLGAAALAAGPFEHQPRADIDHDDLCFSRVRVLRRRPAPHVTRSERATS